MSDCNHEKRTLDYVCIDCGYDLIVDATEEKSRQREQERIIKLLESIATYPNGWDYDDPFSSVIALIKGENK